MRATTKPIRLVLLAMVSLAAFLVAFVSAAAGATTLTFQEPNTGSHVAFIDNSPVPKVISAGDEFVLRKHLQSGGKRIGTLLASCVVTNTTRSFTKAESLCTETYKFGKKGTLTATAINKGTTTTGAITGGTGSYVGAKGSFKSKETEKGATTTITLLE